MNQHSRLAVSTWSLHRLLSHAHVPLLDIPAEAAAHGFGALELVHFHLPTTDAAYLADLRAALADAHVSLHAFLIDTGDPTHPDPTQRAADLQAMSDWIDIAGTLGAQTARVIAGRVPATPDTLALSARNLLPLIIRAEDLGLRLTTENWHQLLHHPADVLALLDRMEGRLGLKMDFGNWPHPRKHADLPLIVPRAESTHAKAFFGEDGAMDTKDFLQCLTFCQVAQFAGTHTLVYDSGGDEWASLGAMREAALPFLA